LGRWREAHRSAIEKSVGESAAEFFQASSRNRNQVMQRDWTWHAFSRALRGDG